MNIYTGHSSSILEILLLFTLVSCVEQPELSGTSSQALGSIVFHDLGTAAPPETIDGITMSQFLPDSRPLSTNVTNIISPLGGMIDFSRPMRHFRIGSGWTTWSHGYQGDVYYTNGAFNVNITLPIGAAAIYLYVEPNQFATYEFTVVATDGGVGGTVSVNGFAGARGFAFTELEGNIGSINIASTTDFAVGEFGIAMGAMTCPSPQMNWIVASASSTALDSTLGDGHSTYFYTTSNNRVNGTPSRDTPQGGQYGVFDDVRRLILSAERQVLFQTFAWEDDSVSEAQLFAGLQTLAGLNSSVGTTRPPDYDPGKHCREGREIDVRILFGTTSPGVHFNTATTVINNALIIRRLDALGKHFDERGIFNLPCVHTLLGLFVKDRSNLHTKSLIIDGHLAMVTSANVQDKWVNEHGFCFEGNVACALQYDFSTAWNRNDTFWYNKKYDFDNDGKVYKHCELCYLDLPCNCYKRGWDSRLPSSELCDPTQPPPLQPPGSTTCGGSPSPPQDVACLPAMVISRSANSFDFGTHVNSTHDYAYVAALESARDVIRIITPNLNTEEMRTNIVYALQNDVHVEILLSKNFNDREINFPVGQLAPPPIRDCQTNEECVDWLVNHSGLPDSIICPLLDIRWWSVDGVTPVEGNQSNFVQSHGKYLSVDKQVAIVGSSNMDYYSFHVSREVDVVIDNTNIVNDWDQRLFVPEFTRGITVDTLVERCSMLQSTPSDGL